MIRGRVGADVYQLGRTGAGSKQQIVRSMPEEVANPQSLTQMEQRMVLGTVAAAFKLLKPVINHSFDGVTAGIASISAFRKMNFPLVRDFCLNGADDGYQFSLNEWKERAALCGAYVVANGAKRFNTWAGGGWKIEPDTSDVYLELLASVPVKDNKIYLSDFKQAWQVGPDGIVTVVGIVATGAHSSRLGYYQLKFKQGLADNTVIATFPNSGDEPTTKASVGDIFDVDANLNPTISMYCVRDEDTQMASIGPKLEGLEDADEQGGAYGLIGAWKTAKGYVHNYVRLDCTVTGSAHYRDNSKVIDTYPRGKSAFLDGGDEYPHVEPINPEPPTPVVNPVLTQLKSQGEDYLPQSPSHSNTSSTAYFNYAGTDLEGAYLAIGADTYSVGDTLDISSWPTNKKAILDADSGRSSGITLSLSYERIYLVYDNKVVSRHNQINHFDMDG